MEGSSYNFHDARASLRDVFEFQLKRWLRLSQIDMVVCCGFLLLLGGFLCIFFFFLIFFFWGGEGSGCITIRSHYSSLIL